MKYRSTINSNSQCMYRLRAILSDKSIAMPQMASGFEILPLAIGLLHLSGWFRSWGASTRSFRIYTEDATKEKAMNPQMAFQSRAGSESLAAKNAGIKTKKFLTQCSTRISAMMFFMFIRGSQICLGQWCWLFLPSTNDWILKSQHWCRGEGKSKNHRLESCKVCLH